MGTLSESLATCEGGFSSSESVMQGFVFRYVISLNNSCSRIADDYGRHDVHVP